MNSKQNVSPPLAHDSVIHVVTPTRNSAAYLENTLLSVISQPGPFSIRYHVQDGGSTDQTMAILERWRSRLESGLAPVMCQGVELTFDSASDRGLYDAVNIGFSKLSDQRPSLMSWINSDDVYGPGAFSTALQVASEVKGEIFLGGCHAHCDEAHALTFMSSPIVYVRDHLRLGLHDGRTLPVVMQEGVFWTHGLWETVGGLRSDLRLAGDFDLWRRFARYAEFVSVAQMLAFHRRRAGQLSSDMTTYYAELDSLFTTEERRAMTDERRRYGAARKDQRVAKALGYLGKVARFDLSKGRWAVIDETCWETSDGGSNLPNCPELGGQNQTESGQHSKGSRQNEQQDTRISPASDASELNLAEECVRLLEANDELLKIVACLKEDISVCNGRLHEMQLSRWRRLGQLLHLAKRHEWETNR